MSGHGHNDKHLTASDTQPLAQRAWPLYRTAFLAGAIGLLVALGAALFMDDGWRRFGYAYIAAYAFFLSIALGCQGFVLATHVCKAGWSVVVRRPAEVFSGALPTLAVLSAPILVFVIANNGAVFPWAQPLPEHGAHGGSHQAAPHNGKDDGGNGNGHASTGNSTDNKHGGASIVTVANNNSHASDRKSQAGHAQGGHAEGEHSAEFWHLVEGKRGYLNIPFFIIRWIGYLVVWSLTGLWLWRMSVNQDENGDERITRKLEIYSAPLTLLFGVTLTFAAFDLIMSLDPTWYSTIFGVYYFAGAFLSAMATLILVFMGLQRVGIAPSVSTEHYHDLGKLLFAFVFFWGYVSFSQFMLYWYGNVPGELPWMERHGLTSVSEDINVWTWWALLLLFGHLLIPFAGLLSRHVKRSRKALAFWAVWLLVFHWMDVYWLVMPEFSRWSIPFSLIELGCLVGVGGVFLGAVVRLAAQHSLVPTKDPRLGESLAFENI